MEHNFLHPAQSTFLRTALKRLLAATSVHRRPTSGIAELNILLRLNTSLRILATPTPQSRDSRSINGRWVAVGKWERKAQSCRRLPERLFFVSTHVIFTSCSERQKRGSRFDSQ